MKLGLVGRLPLVAGLTVAATSFALGGAPKETASVSKARPISSSTVERRAVAQAVSVDEPASVGIAALGGGLILLGFVFRRRRAAN
jgi:hypothetical protein